MEKDQPSQDVTVTSEVQRINRILEIENMYWARQLKQAVNPFYFYGRFPWFIFDLPLLPLSINTSLLYTGFSGQQSLSLAGKLRAEKFRNSY